MRKRVFSAFALHVSYLARKYGSVVTDQFVCVCVYRCGAGEGGGFHDCFSEQFCPTPNCGVCESAFWCECPEMSKGALSSCASSAYFGDTLCRGDAKLEKEFVAESVKAGLLELKGHRSVGGLRSSIYNAMPIEGVDALCNFMASFMQKHTAS